MRADQLLLEQRLEEIEALWLEGMSRSQMIARLQRPGPLPGCPMCLRHPKEQCTHGPPRWSNEAGEPVPARTISWYLQKAKARILEASSKQRRQNWLLTLAQIQRAILRCFQENNLRELGTFLRFRAELDGTKVAAEEAQAPSLFHQVLRQMATCEDYQPGPRKVRKLSASQARFLLERLSYLLDQADASVAAYQLASRPTNDVEARLYLRTQLVEAVHQSLTHPRLPPEGKREALQKLGATYAMISKDADLAEQLAELKEMLQKIQLK